MKWSSKKGRIGCLGILALLFGCGLLSRLAPTPTTAAPTAAVRQLVVSISTDTPIPTATSAPAVIILVPTDTPLSLPTDTPLPVPIVADQPAVPVQPVIPNDTPAVPVQPQSMQAEATLPPPVIPEPTDTPLSQASNDAPFTCKDGCAEPPAGSNCTIKGNVNSKGERIYHMPGGRYYNRTDIKPEEGDRWFCTPSEAEAAGFRAAEQ